MTQKNIQIQEEYFEYLYNFTCRDRYSKHYSFKKLLRYLYDTEFEYSIAMDKNRASDGISLRSRFASYYCIDNEDIEYYIPQPCSVLEMMIALAVRCEENIMDDPKKGNRTNQWFWGMISSLGLNGMFDDRFDEEYVEEVVNRFLDRNYEPDGRGGLFTVRHCDYDLRDVEIWTQLLWYLDEIN